MLRWGITMVDSQGEVTDDEGGPGSVSGEAIGMLGEGSGVPPPHEEGGQRKEDQDGEDTGDVGRDAGGMLVGHPLGEAEGEGGAGEPQQGGAGEHQVRHPVAAGAANLPRGRHVLAGADPVGRYGGHHEEDEAEEGEDEDAELEELAGEGGPPSVGHGARRVGGRALAVAVVVGVVEASRVDQDDALRCRW